MSSVKSNFLWNASFQLLRIVIPLVLTPYLTRTLGSTVLGTYSYTYSIAYYFSLFCLLGLNQYGNREIAKVRDDFNLRSNTFCSIYVMQLVTTLVVVLAYAAFLLTASGVMRTLFLIWAIWIVGEAINVNWLFFGLEEFRITVIRNFIVRLVTVGLIFLLVKGPDDLWIYCLLQALYFLVSYVALLPFLKTRVHWVRPRLEEVVRHIKPNLMLFAPIVAISVYTQLGKILLGNLGSMDDVAFFDNSEKIVQIPLAVIQALGTAMLPRMTNIIANGDNSLGKEYLGSSFWFASIMACAFAFGIASVAHEFVAVFFGPGFESCEAVIYVLAWMIPLVSWSNVLGVQYLLPSGRDKEYIVSVLAGAVVNIAVSAALIVPLGALGASAATVAAELTVTLVQACYARGNLHLCRHLVESAPYVAVGILMTIIVRISSTVLPVTWVGLAAEVLVGGISFVLFAAAYLYVTKDKHLKGLLSR